MIDDQKILETISILNGCNDQFELKNNDIHNASLINRKIIEMASKLYDGCTLKNKDYKQLSEYGCPDIIDFALITDRAVDRDDIVKTCPNVTCIECWENAFKNILDGRILSENF